MNRSLIALALSLFVAGCTAPPPAPVGQTAEALRGVVALPPVLDAPNPVRRPLVLLVSPVPGPTGPANKNWLTHDSPSAATSFRGGTLLESWIVPNDGVACSALYGARATVKLKHPRPADLIITLSTEYGEGRSDSVKVWDGPASATGKSADAIAKLTLPPELDAPDLIKSHECARWRLTIVDQGTRGGVLTSWTLKRRIAFAPIHDAAYYEQLIFGGTDPSVARFFWEESRCRFTFAKAGVYTAPWTNWYKATDDSHIADIYYRLGQQGFDFDSYDTDNSGTITDDELEFADIDNVFGNAGANRGGKCVPVPSRVNRVGVGPVLFVCSRVALISSTSDFQTAAHELSHSLGTVDLYADGCRSLGLTLMSCTIGGPDERTTLYHDPFHRSMLGWLQPYDGAFYAAGQATLGDETYSEPSGSLTNPVRLRNPSDPTEYFLFEYRARRGYDANMSDPLPGIAVWHVKEDGNGRPFEIRDLAPFGQWTYAISPDNDYGGRSLWHDANGRFQIKWKDGSVAPFTFWTEERSDSASSMYLHWDLAPANNQPPAVRIVSPGDGSALPYGYGNPVGFEADGTDSRGARNLTFSWTSDKEGPLGTGATLAYAFGTPGDRIITVTAHDPYGASATVSVKLTLTNGGPTARIDAPTDGAELLRNVPFVLTGGGSSPGALSLPCANLQWTVDRLFLWRKVGGRADQTGPCTVNETFGFTGPATFTLTATDEYGVSTRTRVSVNFVDPPAASPPIVTILAPGVARLMLDTPVHVVGSVVDPQGGATSYRWTVFDTNTNQELELASVADFTWTPRAQFNFSTVAKLRLYGANAAGVVTMAEVTETLAAPTR